MSTARIAVAGLYPLNLTVPPGELVAKVRSNAYMWRRGMPGVAEKLSPPLSEAQMSALGNWKTKKTMSSHYAWSKEAMSFIVKYTCVEAVRRTSAQKEILHGTEKAWEFSWGDISKYVQDSSDIVQEAGKLCSDIGVDAPANPLLEGKTLGLPSIVAEAANPAGLTLRDEGSPCKKARVFFPHRPNAAGSTSGTGVHKIEIKQGDTDDESLADDSVSSTSMSSQDLQTFEDELLDKQATAYGTLLVSGKGNTTKVHLTSPTDDEDADRSFISAWCGSKLHRNSAYQEVARHFNIHQRKACPKCKPDYPPELEALLWG